MKALVKRAFAFYVLLILLLWSFVRMVSPELLAQLTDGINIPTILEYYGIFYDTQHVPEDNAVQKFAPVVFLLFLSLAYFSIGNIISIANRVLKNSSILAEPSANSVRNIWLTGLVVMLFFLIKELTVPFHFIEDDNHSQFLPKMMVGMDILFGGEIPFIDNYHHFGAQLFEVGTYAYFDPLMILSYVTSKYLIASPYVLLDLYVMLSGFAGAVFLGYAFRKLKIGSFLSFCAIVSFIMSGYFLITARNWYYSAGIACYIPVLFYYYVCARDERPGWSWFLQLGILRALFFYAGNAQFFIYAILLELVCYVFTFLKSDSAGRVLPPYFCSLALTIGIVAPLFLCQFNLLREIERWPDPLISYNGTPFDTLISWFYPYPFSWSPSFEWNIKKNVLVLSNMFHIGFVWVFPFIFGFLHFLRYKTAWHLPVMVLGVMLFIISAGSVSLIYPLKYYLPVFDKMKWAYKIYPYASFVIVIYGVLVLNRLWRYGMCRKAIRVMAGASVALTLLTVVFGTNGAFFNWGEKPYPSLNAGVSRHIDREKDIVFGLAPDWYSGKPYVTSLTQNYGNLYGIKTTNFYDPLLPTKIKGYPDTAEEYFKKYGITKVILLKTSANEYIDWKYPHWKDIIEETWRFPILYEDQDVVICSTNQPAWIFRQSDDSAGQASCKIMEYDRTKIKAAFSSSEKLRWEYHNEFKKGYFIKVNGKSGEITASPDGWCMFELSSGESQIEIRYKPPVLEAGATGGMLLSLLAIVSFALIRKRPASRVASIK